METCLILHDEALHDSFSVFPLLLWYSLNFSLAFPLPTQANPVASRPGLEAFLHLRTVLQQRPCQIWSRACTLPFVLSPPLVPVDGICETQWQFLQLVLPGHVRLSVNINNKLGAKVMTLEQFATIDLVDIGICLTESTWTVNLYLVNFIYSVTAVYYISM